MSEELEFEHIDADAVCEQCGTVNPEETLLCKTCGNNLKEQRQRRIAQTHATPLQADPKGTSIRLLTGLLSVMGILVVLVVVLNLSNIEAALVGVLSTQGAGIDDDLWTGETGALLDELTLELDEFPSSTSMMVESIRIGLAESSYNGRYVLVDVDLIARNGILGEANLRKVGDLVYFAAAPKGTGARVRGVARVVHSQEGGARLEARNAAVEVDDIHYPGWGFSAIEEEGGHFAVGKTDFNNVEAQVLAYRIR